MYVALLLANGVSEQQAAERAARQPFSPALQ
jgi:hypothetical protein